MKSINRYASSTQGAKLGSSDPIAAAIGLLRPLTVSESSLHAAGPWAVGFDPFPHVELGVVARGECWLTMEGHEPVLLREGDFYLLGNPPPYVLASAPTEQPLDARSLWGGSPRGAVRIGSEAQEDTYLCGGHFSFDDTNAPVLLDVLPPLVHVRAADPRGKLLAHLSALLVTEVETTAVGGSLVLDHLAQILFIHMLRAHAAHADRPGRLAGSTQQRRHRSRTPRHARRRGTPMDTQRTRGNQPHVTLGVCRSFQDQDRNCTTGVLDPMAHEPSPRRVASRNSVDLRTRIRDRL